MSSSSEPTEYSPEELERLKQLRDQLKLAADHQRFNKLLFYEPYPKQAGFHDLGLSCDERCLFGGNQLGKTECGAAEAAMHATGLYPDWWLGRRITRANRGIAGGESSILVRDGAQKKLLGTPGVVEAFGTGYIPKHLIVDVSLARGVTDAYDTVQVRHVDGDISTIVFKSYEQGRAKWQTDTVDWVWFDEEPPPDIYSEGLARYTATRGFSYMTFTPLGGMSSVVLKFLGEQEAGTRRGHVFLGFDDVPTMSAEDKAAALAKYPAHEREARSKGLPMLGEGRVFMTPEESILEDPLTYVPPHWRKISGIDFGVHFGWVLLLHDVDNDVIHLHADARIDNAATHREHCARIKTAAADVPVAWPSDGNSRQKDGKVVKGLYSAEGLQMLADHATFANGSVSVEAGLLEMDDRMKTGRWKVSRTCTAWLAEYRLYHREEGKIVKENDHVLDASRYAFMMRRFAKPVALGPDRFAHGARRRQDDGMCQDHDYDLWSV